MKKVLLAGVSFLLMLAWGTPMSAMEMTREMALKILGLPKNLKFDDAGIKRLKNHYAHKRQEVRDVRSLEQAKNFLYSISPELQQDLHKVNEAEYVSEINKEDECLDLTDEEIDRIINAASVHPSVLIESKAAGYRYRGRSDQSAYDYGDSDFYPGDY
jgi:hypothetical protein